MQLVQLALSLPGRLLWLLLLLLLQLLLPLLLDPFLCLPARC